MPWITAHYRVESSADEIEAFAQTLALEQSVEVPLAAVRDGWIAEHIVGKVRSIAPRADGAFDVAIALATATTGWDVAQTINMLFGNASLHAAVQLADVELPLSLVTAFPRPRFGIAGLRARTGVVAGPLACVALKPQGMPPRELAKLYRLFAQAGVDVVKDDHGIADQSYSRFAERVAAVQQVADEVRRATGRAPLYAPSLVGSPVALSERLRIVRDEGVSMVLIAPALIGMPVFAELIMKLDVPVLAHPAYTGATRVAAPLLLGKFFRLLGADATIFPSFGGRFAFDRKMCGAIATAARAPWHDVAATLPVPAGGMTVERVPELVDFYGPDTMLLIGGSILAADDVAARARAFANAVKGAFR